MKKPGPPCRRQQSVSVGTVAPTLIFCLVIALFLPGPSRGAAVFSYERIVAGLSYPVAVTHAGDSSGRLFITLQEGLVVIYDGRGLRPAPFLDITDLVIFGGERGLLSVAFHPKYPEDPSFFVNYTDRDGNTVVARYRTSADPDVADAASGSTVLTVPQPFGNHNGGQMQFGPDGYLYIGMGDGGGAGDPLLTAQDLTTLLGKMLRIDVDTDIPYGTPPDNPFVNDPSARDEIWAVGLRNPWRFSFDRLTGDLIVGDVGQHRWEEIDFQPAGSGGGINYGWSLMEGRHCFEPAEGCNDGSLRLPVIEYSHDAGCSVTGGYRYRGNSIPLLQGVYLFADYCSGQVWGAMSAGGQVRIVELLNAPFRISSFGEDEKGEIYILAFAPPESSALHRITQVEEISFSVAPPTATVPVGGALEVRVRAANNSHLAQEIVFTSRVVTPSGDLYPPNRPLFGPARVILQPFSNRETVLFHAVPPSAPAGAYQYSASVIRPGGRILGADAFPFALSPR